VALRLLVLLSQDLLPSPLPEAVDWTTIGMISGLLLCDLALLVWQVRGVFRTINRQYASHGLQNMVFLLHLGVVLGVLMTVLSGLGTVQSLWFGPDDRFAKYKPFTWLEDYQLSVEADGRKLFIEGDFKTGITLKVAELLSENPLIDEIILQSRGGRVAEGRALAELIKSQKLATRVSGTCSSACATAFIGGAKRTLGPDGRLGFHSFRLDAPYYNPEIKAGVEQEADLAFYVSQGLSPSFLERVFKAEASDIWYPDHRHLLQAGVVHQILKN
jgi:hypothetical protein